ncbi:MAG: GAF domain-containing protein [Chloroflexi bacterium]|nr:MAG: hypothetical protein CUN54_07175 [Phototrophicales bacterium]RMF80971.1 MAG: GAF domain-containing protein [Chloroflexota bacterium]
MQEHELAQRVELLERRVQILNRLAEMSTAINSTLQLEPLLQLIMQAAAEITDSDSASVLLWNRHTNKLFFAATTSSGTMANSLIGQPVPLKGSIAGTALTENRIEVVNDVTADSRHYSGIDEKNDFETRSILAVPMRLKDRPIGVLEAVNKHELPWTEDDNHYLSILAAQAAVAIESAELVTALKKANTELSEIDKLKNDFIAIASHELRTPLGVIMGYASFLQESDDKEVVGHAQKVLDSALALRQLIEDLTNLRYLQQKQIDLHREPVTVSKLVQECLRNTREFAETRGHQLEIVLAASDVELVVDVGRIQMALNNILNNAMRFTPDGGHIVVQTEINNDNEVWIKVIDNGIGLEPEQSERIFEQFYQVENHLTRVHGGLGIGLSIAKGMIEAHGGRIWVTSNGLNTGTTFTIALPIEEEILREQSS